MAKWKRWPKTIELPAVTPGVVPADAPMAQPLPVEGAPRAPATIEMDTQRGRVTIISDPNAPPGGISMAPPPEIVVDPNVKDGEAFRITPGEFIGAPTAIVDANFSSEPPTPLPGNPIEAGLSASTQAPSMWPDLPDGRWTRLVRSSGGISIEAIQTRGGQVEAWTERLEADVASVALGRVQQMLVEDMGEAEDLLEKARPSPLKRALMQAEKMAAKPRPEGKPLRVLVEPAEDWESAKREAVADGTYREMTVPVRSPFGAAVAPLTHIFGVRVDEEVVQVVRAR